MDTKILLKVKYNGMMRHVVCNANSRYADIIDIVIERFRIPKEFKKALHFSSDSGYVLDKDVFENFVLLFPTPEITFNIRVDHKKIMFVSDKLSSGDPSIRPFALTQRQNMRRVREQDADDETNHYAPVRRQNAFIGSLPVRAVSGELERQNYELQPYFSRQTSKRMRLMPVTRKPKELKKSLKRVIRI